MKWYWLIVGVLGVWRVTHLLHAELGPWKCLERFRKLVERWLRTKIFGCFYCLSVWIALPFALVIGEGPKEKVLLWLACSAGAILLERTSNKAMTSPFYLEDPEKPL